MKPWLQWNRGLTSKPEMVLIARKLGITPQEVAGRCMQVWEWVDAKASQGIIIGPPDLAAVMVDTAAGREGFAEAMQAVGWLTINAAAKNFQFPNWKRWNPGESSKEYDQDSEARREAERLRKDEYRKRPKTEDQKPSTE